MAETKETITVTPAESNEALVKARGFWDKYSKPITYIGSVVILGIVGWYAYVNLVKLPKEKTANELIFPAEGIVDKMATTSFSKDSVNIALNGGALEGKKITGLLKIISSYGGTKAGDRANFLVGACYLHIKEFDKAIKYLKEFEGADANQVKSAAFKMIGDAYSEQKKTDDALNYYKKAADVNEKDESLAPNAFMNAANYADAIGKTKDAIELYKAVKSKYPTSSSVSSGDVDKELARLGELNNN